MSGIEVEQDEAEIEMWKIRKVCTDEEKNHRAIAAFVYLFKVFVSRVDEMSAEAQATATPLLSFVSSTTWLTCSFTLPHPLQPAARERPRGGAGQRHVDDLPGDPPQRTDQSYEQDADG